MLEERERSMTATNSYPKINFKSLATSVDDTMYDYNSSTVDQIALKYLPKDMLHQHQLLQQQQQQQQQHHQQQREEFTTNKTVKFEGVYEWQSTNTKGGMINQNMASVNFSCNMSIASRKYLQKYSLVDDDKDLQRPGRTGLLKDQNGRQAAIADGCYSSDNKEDGSETLIGVYGKENRILDFERLRSLPKLK